MASYELQIKASVRKDLQAVPRPELSRILDRMQQLAVNPRARGCIKLCERDLYRCRVGSWRILYEIIDDMLIVIVVKVALRRDAYR